MNKIQRGFTLIELMVVVAIIGVLAAIAIVQYQDYVIRTQMTAALADIAGGKVIYEVRVNEGILTTPTEYTIVTNLGLHPTTLRCSAVNATPPDAQGSGTISCTVNGSAAIKGSTVTLTRQAAGIWDCTVTHAGTKWKNLYLPPGCTKP